MGNPMFHWEFMVSDVAKAISFYSSVFDWEFDETSFPTYPLIKTGGKPGGALMLKPSEAHTYRLNAYFHVENIEVTLTRAEVAGGKLIAPKMAIPGVGHWAMFTDPDGILIGIMQMENA